MYSRRASDKHKSGEVKIEQSFYDDLEELRRNYDNLVRRVSALDGNGSDLAEGGVIGRLRKEHNENKKTLTWILRLVVATLIALVGNLLIKIK